MSSAKLSIHQVLETLCEGQSLPFAQCYRLFSEIIGGKLSDIEIAALITALKCKGETAEEIAAAAKALQDAALPFASEVSNVSDCCGTGGSGKHTLNISTLVAIVAASLGVPVAKHGNRSVSSQCGSADVLENLGLDINAPPEHSVRLLKATNFCFLFAPLYHGGIRNVMPVRQRLKVRTLFNRLGPLLNPAGASIQLLGIFDPQHAVVTAESLNISGCKRAMIVHSCGCDEITLAGITEVTELKDGQISQYRLTASDFGLPNYELTELVGGSPQTNAELFMAVLSGRASMAMIDTVVANSAALLYLNECCTDLKQGAELAKQAILDGTALKNFERIIRFDKSTEAVNA